MTKLFRSNSYFGKDLEAMSFAVNYHKWILSEFKPYIGNHVAEVGAGVGNFSKLLLEGNIKSLIAFEPSDNMYPLLKKALRGDKRSNAINAFFGQEKISKRFDTVIYVNVLEHIKDDASELVYAYDALVAGGHLLIFVPALSWLYSNLDRDVGHFRRYTKSNLKMLVQEAGFTVVEARYFDVAGIIPWYINFRLLNNSISSGSVSLYDHLVVPLMRRIERFLHPPIGKNVLLIARKA